VFSIHFFTFDFMYLTLLFECRGPSYGYRGKVLLAFEENGFSKVGVRFDKQIPDGNDLGGLCEEDHGFFCTGDSPNPFFNKKTLGILRKGYTFCFVSILLMFILITSLFSFISLFS